MRSPFGWPQTLRLGLPLFALLLQLPVTAQDTSSDYIAAGPVRGAFPLIARGVAVPVWVSAEDYPGVRRAATSLQADLGRVAGVKPRLLTDPSPTGATMVLI